MSLFAPPAELAALGGALAHDPWLAWHHDRFLDRAAALCAKPELMALPSTVPWWYAAFDRVACVAGAQVLRPDPARAAWLRAAVLDLARRPLHDWVGPPFRDHDTPAPIGHLETAHLAWAVAFALDLVPDAFAGVERAELRTCLRERAIGLSRRWAEVRDWRNNWAMILLAGQAVAAAVLDEGDEMAWAVRRYRELLALFEDDGSYGESLQYASYAAYGLCLCHEALRRRDARLADRLPLPHAAAVRWWAQGHLGMKPLPGWGAGPLPRSVNFGDSAALFRPHGDVLSHFAARAQQPEAGLARWLTETCYPPTTEIADGDRAGFGFVNQLSWLSLLLRPAAATARSPQEAGLPTCAPNRLGECYVRRSWAGATVLAIAGSAGPCRVRNHRHADAGSFVLSHRGERLLVDPGHSCYRSPLQAINRRTDSHTTWSFSGHGQLDHPPGRATPPEGRLLVAGQRDEVCAVGFELAPRYPAPLVSFQRFWLLAGDHVLFVIDRIAAAAAVCPAWHWLLNNRDGLLAVTGTPTGLRARHGGVGLLLGLPPGIALAGPEDRCLHLAYHPEPGGLGEGRPGSALRYTGRARAGRRWLVCHALAVDARDRIGGWRLAYAERGRRVSLVRGDRRWHLRLAAGSLSLTGNGRFELRRHQDGTWTAG